MSPARQHRERHATVALFADTRPIASESEGGQEPFTYSPARAHLFQALAASASQPQGESGSNGETVALIERDPATAQIMMRLGHDLRRLRAIASIEKKIEAKREMLPAYLDWVLGLVDAARDSGQTVADEVLPTIMVWAIDIGNFDLGLDLAAHVMKFSVPLPKRYVRSAPALVAELIAEAALKDMLAEREFPIAVLERVDAMTADADMHDEIRAKLKKALGFAYATEAEALGRVTPNTGPEKAAQIVEAANLALVPLRRAQELHDRSGVKDRIKRVEKLLPPKPHED